MSFITTSLPSLDDFPSSYSEKLPELHPLFFTPPLEDKPQDSIVDALVRVPAPPDIKRANVPQLQEETERNEDGESVEEDLWTSNGVSDGRRQPQVLSWDVLRPTYSAEKTTAFLSEQSNEIFNAVRHHVLPRLNDPSLRLLYILPTELMELLMVNMVGNSSSLFIWDAEQECFVPKGTQDGTSVVVMVEGLDSTASESIIKRYLTIGMLFRRLDTLVVSIQRRSRKSAIHALSHALSTVLVHIRSLLTSKSLHSATHFISLWLRYADEESLLTALAELCHLSGKDKPPYEPLPESPAVLLSHIYKHLQWHLEHQASRVITAAMAYILTTVSRDYFTKLGESLGIFEPTRPLWLRTATTFTNNLHPSTDMLRPEDDILDQVTTSSISEDSEGDELPDFFPPELAEALPTTRKSLRILQTANPDHPLCFTASLRTCQWVWSQGEIEQCWSDERRGNIEDNFDSIVEQSSVVATPHSTKYKPELDGFQLFDLEPGACLPKSTSSPISLTTHSSFESFLSAFPERLPPLTPTLHHVTTVVLQPLLTRTIHVSSSLLHLILTTLHLEAHFTLLRSYLLLTLPSFKGSLVGALFSDSAEFGARARIRAQPGSTDANDTANAAVNGRPMIGIGLGHGLVERNAWPPGGADLSFLLRTVIVDSLERETAENKYGETEYVWKEAEVRIGFALRDLPVGDGRERWLNPMSIEALDFLYLNYKPPHPLDIILTPDALSKYQRIFGFLLRLLRAESVTRIIFRSSFKAGALFERSPGVQKMHFRLRFQIHSFVTSLLTYVFDYAIGGTYDAHMHLISKLREDILNDNLTADGNDIVNVFVLAESHSDMLNRLLSACLLRRSQSSAGDTLRDLLELVLQFGALLMSAQHGYLTETDAIEQVQLLDKLFAKRMLSFVKCVRAEDMKYRAISRTADSLHPLGRMRNDSPYASPYSPCENLLARVDPTGWWRTKLVELSKLDP